MTTSRRSPHPVETQPAATPLTSSTRGVRVGGLRKTFRRRQSNEEVPAIAGIDLTVSPGELVVLLGPSGCGKTTLLRCIAGLEAPDAGRIEVAGRAVFDSEQGLDIPVEKRPSSMVFQSYALWPHMSVFDNVAYPLRSRGVAKREIHERVERIFEAVGIANLRDQYPAQLSGGQQQRVSLARAIVSGQEVILFDEPLSNVDAKVRDRLRIEIQQMQHDLGFTALYVTHDQEEAMMLGDRIAVLEEGRIAQLGTPRELYATPATQYVANFIGTADRFAGRVTASNATSVEVTTEVGRFASTRATDDIGTEVVVMTRPEAWRLAAADSHQPTQLNEVSGTVLSSMFLGGGKMEYVVRTDDATIRAWGFDPTVTFSVDDPVTITCSPDDVMVYAVPTR